MAVRAGDIKNHNREHEHGQRGREHGREVFDKILAGEFSDEERKIFGGLHEQNLAPVNHDNDELQHSHENSSLVYLVLAEQAAIMKELADHPELSAHIDRSLLSVDPTKQNISNLRALFVKAKQAHAEIEQHDDHNEHSPKGKDTTTFDSPKSILPDVLNQSKGQVLPGHTLSGHILEDIAMKEVGADNLGFLPAGTSSYNIVASAIRKNPRFME